MFLLLAVLATREPAATRAADSPLLGKPAPAIAGDTLDGGRVELSQYRGKWVLLNFFATWCVPCRNEHPDLINFAARHARADDAVVLGVIYDDSTAAVAEFLREKGGAWPMVVDPRGRIALDYGVAGVPESYLISPGGSVAAKVIGGVRVDALEELLDKVKAATPPGG